MKVNQRGKNVVTVETSNGDELLFSYSVPVAFYDGMTHQYIITEEHHSPTTTKHINLFIHHGNLDEVEKEPQAWFDNLRFDTGPASPVDYI